MPNTSFDPSSVCAAVLDCAKQAKRGLSPRDFRLTLDHEFKEISMYEVLLAMQALIKEGLLRECSDEMGVYEYWGNPKQRIWIGSGEDMKQI